MKLFFFLQSLKFLFFCCNYNAFFTLYGFRECSDFVTGVPQTVSSLKTTCIGKLSEILKTSFAIDISLVCHGALVFPLQGSFSNLYGNKSVRPSYIEYVGGDTGPLKLTACCAMLFVDITVNTGDSLY